MEEALALIEKIIEEHKQILGNIRALEQVTNDAGALRVLDIAKEGFMPGRPDQAEGLHKLDELLAMTNSGIRAHFNREETGLLAAFEEHGGEMLISALRALLLEHDVIRKRFVHAEQLVTELKMGDLSRYVWEASAYDMRAHIAHTRKLFEVHARSEQNLLRTLRNRLRGEVEEK